MGEALQRRGCTINVEAARFRSPEPVAQQVADLVDGREREVVDLIEAPPQGWIEKLLVICRRDQQAGAPKRVEHLEECRHNALDLAMFSGVISRLAERIELVKEQNPRALAYE